MTIQPTSVFRVRKAGSGSANTNGGGYDPAIASTTNWAAQSGSLGTVSGSTFSDSGASFTSAMTGASLWIYGVGIFQVTYLSSTSFTISGYCPPCSKMTWKLGSGVDYSQQDSPQATGTNGTASGTTAFTDTTAANFTPQMIGNALYLSGTGLTTGVYFITAYTSATAVTLDRSPGTGTTGTWYLGGAWADFWTNTTATATFASNCLVYIRGSGIPTPGTGGASYVYDYTKTSAFTLLQGDSFGTTTLANDPTTPNFSTGGKPCISTAGRLTVNSYNTGMDGLWIVANNTTAGNSISNQWGGFLRNCVYDQNGYDVGFSSDACFVYDNECTSNRNSRGGSPVQTMIAQNQSNGNGGRIFGNNIHDCLAAGIYVFNAGVAAFNVISKCGSYGIYGYGAGFLIHNNTVDGNLSDGIHIDNALASMTSIFNNIISNHASGYGMNISTMTAAQNALSFPLINFNTFYNNNVDCNVIFHGANDTLGGIPPFTNEPGNDFSLVSGRWNAGCAPGAALPQFVAGWR